MTHPPRTRAPSRAAVLGVVAVVAALALGGTFWWRARRPGAGDTSPPGDVISAQVGALTAQLVGDQIALARADLQNKDYRGAIAQAARALRLDPDSSEARKVLVEAEARLAVRERQTATAHDPAIRQVIAEYARALEGKDKSRHVAITIDSIQVEGAQATVRVSRQDTVDGKPMSAVHQTFRLVRGGPGWTIRTIGQ